ncbi:MAG: peroxide stress protein YaaA [Alcaligenaceae bacterium]|nr:peroxide stress protein YaaA [Alcaligenaceae bacterium]
MFYLISPAKRLDFQSPLPTQQHSLPQFLSQSAHLIERLRTLSASDLKRLMSLSDNLVALNLERYQEWTTNLSLDNARQAIFGFHGDVYQGLDVATLSVNDLDWLNNHLGILSGLYGLLRPYDLIQAHRLEMGTKLENQSGKNLYDYWTATLTNYVETSLSNMSNPVLVNLCSEEYFKSIDTSELSYPVVKCVFKEYKNGQYKVVAIHAKRARGAMLRFATQHRIDQVEGLKAFDVGGYQFNQDSSTKQVLTFHRRLDQSTF